MKVADVNCDTLTEFISNPFYSVQAQWSLHKFKFVGGIL